MKDYKKILEGIVKIISTTEKSDIGFVNICTYIDENCPELKESEDERTRKEIIDYFWKEKIFLQEAHSSVENNPKYRFVMDAIAWLEKQESVEEIVSRCKTSWYNEGKIQGQIEGLSDEEKYQQGWHDALEKQGEQPRYSIGDVLCDKSCTTLNKDAQPNFEITDIRNGMYICDKCSFPISQQDEYELVAKKIEQKPTDKVEPKFHVGEWLCENEPNNYARFLQILEIVNVQGKERYRISRDIHNDEDIVEFDFVEKYYHKFDIKDAKDGDVLVHNDCAFIFVGLEGNIVMALAKTLFDGIIPIYFGEIDENNDYHPATKEQRDFLFKSMKDDGYEWDAEKKELKKIEQKPAEWSEEDDYNAQCMIAKAANDIQNGNVGRNNELIDWLKSLKDRVQPKQEWSEEDIRNIDVIDTLLFYDKDLPEDTCVRLRNWLETLKPQTQWKPTEEQMNALSNALSLAKSCGEESSFDLRTLYEQLKKLKE